MPGNLYLSMFNWLKGVVEIHPVLPTCHPGAVNWDKSLFPTYTSLITVIVSTSLWNVRIQNMDGRSYLCSFYSACLPVLAIQVFNYIFTFAKSHMNLLNKTIKRWHHTHDIMIGSTEIKVYSRLISESALFSLIGGIGTLHKVNDLNHSCLQAWLNHNRESIPTFDKEWTLKTP